MKQAISRADRQSYQRIANDHSVNPMTRQLAVLRLQTEERAQEKRLAIAAMHH